MATDVYALGVLLYLIVCGRRPYQLAGRSAAEIERVVCESTPVRPSATFDVNGAQADDQAARALARGATPSRVRRRLRGDVDTIVMKALRHEPERRYASVAALQDDLRRFSQDTRSGATRQRRLSRAEIRWPSSRGRGRRRGVARARRRRRRPRAHTPVPRGSRGGEGENGDKPIW